MKIYKISLQRLKDIVRYFEQDRPSTPHNSYKISTGIFIEIIDDANSEDSE